MLIIVLLVTDGLVGFRSILSIRESTSKLTETHFRNVMLIDEAQRVQTSMSSVLHRIAAGEASRDRKSLESRVDSVEESYRKLFASIAETDPDRALWRAVEQASREVTREADRILETNSLRPPDLTGLIAARERLLESTTALIRANHESAAATRKQIEEMISTQVARDAVLLSTCVVVAIICAWLVVTMASRMQGQITSQNLELAKVTWQLMERQEILARRLSHELHDELGQSLTALKTNLSHVASTRVVESKWVEDCSLLLKDSIRSAHEISQLLRPTILDDFGLTSALEWLCNRFEERNRIEVQFQSNVQDRFEPQTETHVFRIAQEALTNIARHASATKVEVAFCRNGDKVVLQVRDNGIGITPKPDSAPRRFGLTGIQARARSLAGSLRIRSGSGEGTEIILEFPYLANHHHEEDQNLTG